MKKLFVLFVFITISISINAQITGEMELAYIEAWNLLNDGHRNKDDIKLKQAFEKMKASANMGHPFAQHELARNYETGEGCPVNFEEAYRWMYLAANNPNWSKMTDEQKKFWDNSIGDSFFFLGVYCMDGIGTSKDMKRAMDYWQQGSQNKGFYQKNCYLQLAFGYEQGWGGYVRSANKAVEMFKKASDLGDADAPFYLASYYTHGEGGLKQSDENAFNCTKLSAERGFVQAIYAMGIIYEGGYFGQISDMKKAVEWYIMAAKRKYTDAIVRLSELGVDWR